MSLFTAISSLDLSQLPAPGVVETLDYEAIVAAMLADLRDRDPTFDALVESDPAFKILEVCAYRELLIRQRVNDAARATMLAFALGADLDHIGATRGVVRLDDEADEAFRARIQLAPEGYTTAGSEGSYLFHGKSASAEVLDIQATSPTPDDIRQLVLQLLEDHEADPELISDMEEALDAAVWPGTVNIHVLSDSEGGAAGPELLGLVEEALNAEQVRPLTDHVVVQSAEVAPFTIEAVLTIYPGPDAELVRQAAEDAAAAYVASVHRLGYDVTRSGLFAALHQPGVQNVDLIQPAADIVNGVGQASYVTAIDVTAQGPDV